MQGFLLPSAQLHLHDGRQPSRGAYSLVDGVASPGVYAVGRAR